MTGQIDEIRLQRLVDGALSEGERGEFLAGLDQSPELWREVALAFVEDQIFASELDTSRRPQEIADTTTRKPQASAFSSPALVLAIAVTLLAMFGVGFRWGQWQAETPTSPIAPRIAATDDTEPVMEDREVPRDEAPSPEPTYRLVLGRQDGQAVELPVYERAQLADLPWEPADMGRLQRLNETLGQRGYRADMRTEYLSGQLEDGRQIVVPCRTVSLKYDAQ